MKAHAELVAESVFQVRKTHYRTTYSATACEHVACLKIDSLLDTCSMTRWPTRSHARRIGVGQRRPPASSFVVCGVVTSENDWQPFWRYRIRPIGPISHIRLQIRAIHPSYGH